MLKKIKNNIKFKKRKKEHTLIPMIKEEERTEKTVKTSKAKYIVHHRKQSLKLSVKDSLKDNRKYSNNDNTVQVSNRLKLLLTKDNNEDMNEISNIENTEKSKVTKRRIEKKRIEY